MLYCETYRGNLYNESASQTYQSVPNVTESGADPYDTYTNVSRNLWFTDGFRLTDDAELSAYSMGIMRSDVSGRYHSQHILGLGLNSTLLSALTNAGKVASRSWSMFWGLTGSTSSTQMDGVFVFGGYDSAKTTGKNYTAGLSSNENCASGMLVTITDIELNFPNGSSSSVFGSSSSAALSACIVPDFPVLMTLPLDPFYSEFESIAGISEYSSNNHSYGINFYGQLYPDTVE